MVRVTLGGGTLDTFAFQGFDQWFRLALPVADRTRFDNLPEQFGMVGYLKYLTLPKGTRPVIRNDTVRDFRPDPVELDIDFVVHGTKGLAGPWAETVEPGAEVAFIDQGCGFVRREAARTLLVADESGLPAVAGVLGDLPRDTVGDAIVELFDDADRQTLDAPEGMRVHWLVRGADAAPGDEALRALGDLDVGEPEALSAFAVGESALATGARRFLVNERAVPKKQITFCGYWKRGRAAG